MKQKYFQDILELKLGKKSLEMPLQHLRSSTHALTSNTNNFGFDKMLVKQHLKPKYVIMACASLNLNDKTNFKHIFFKVQ